jgi:hypothetical protein
MIRYAQPIVDVVEKIEIDVSAGTTTQPMRK